MNVFIINFALLIIEGMFLVYKPRSNPRMTDEMRKKRRKRFVFLACIQWILISGLRSDLVGSDTNNYLAMFDRDILMSWDNVFKYFKEYYVNDNPHLGIEPGFVLFERLIGEFTTSHVAYNFIVATIFMGSMGVFIYRNSEDPFMSFLLYSGLFYNMFSLTGYRQVISVAIGILWSYEFLKKRKFILFLILVLIASTIHKSTLIFIVFYFLSQKKLTKFYVVTAIFVILMMIPLRNDIFLYVGELAGYDEYGVESGFTQTNFLIMFTALSILSIWRYKFVVVGHPEVKVYYNGLIMSAAMIPFAMVSPTSMRLVYDFAFQLMFLLPLIMDSFETKKDRMLTYSVVVAVFAYFIATKAPEYSFFWQLKYY